MLGPSVYARQPVPVVVPEFKDRDPVKIATCEMLERALVKSYDLTGIDQVMRLVRDDLLIVGRGVLWVRYEDKGEVEDDHATQTTGERLLRRISRPAGTSATTRPAPGPRSTGSPAAPG